MLLLAVARLPSSCSASDPASAPALVEAARVTGLSALDVRTRLAGPLPRVLLIEAVPARASTLATALEELGFAVLVGDPRAAPGDDDRLQARGLRFDGPVLSVQDGLGAEEEVPLSAVSLIQGGVRATMVTEVTTTAERRLDLTRALLTGGLMLTKKAEKKTTRTTTTREPFLLLHRSDGGRDVMVYERRMDYRLLGGTPLPSSAGNFQRVLARLREEAPGIPHDDRVSRPGFLSGLPVTTVAPLDVALWLVHLVHLRGLAAA